MHIVTQNSVWNQCCSFELSILYFLSSPESSTKNSKQHNWS